MDRVGSGYLVLGREHDQTLGRVQCQRKYFQRFSKVTKKGSQERRRQGTAERPLRPHGRNRFRRSLQRTWPSFPPERRHITRLGPYRQRVPEQALRGQRTAGALGAILHKPWEESLKR